MGKKIFGGGKKKKVTESGPVIIPLNPEDVKKTKGVFGGKRGAVTAERVTTLLSEKLGDGKTWKLGG